MVQAVADEDKRCLDVAAGFLGSMHDSRVLRNGVLYRQINNNELLLGPTVRVGSREVKPSLLGDSSYPLSGWLLKNHTTRLLMTQRKLTLIRNFQVLG